MVEAVGRERRLQNGPISLGSLSGMETEDSYCFESRRLRSVLLDNRIDTAMLFPCGYRM